jgi:hypothetical protein
MKGNVMAQKTNCMTPGTIYSTHISPTSIVLKVDFPQHFVLYEEEVKQLEKNLHNAVELVLAPMFVRAGLLP